MAATRSNSESKVLTDLLLGCDDGVGVADAFDGVDTTGSSVVGSGVGVGQTARAVVFGKIKEINKEIRKI
jgi:hypothetical protein